MSWSRSPGARARPGAAELASFSGLAASTFFTIPLPNDPELMSNRPRKRPRPRTDQNGGNREDRNPSTGRFLRGNQAASGPHLTRRRQLDDALRRTISEQDVADVASALLQRARDGDVRAASALLDRVLGIPARNQASVHEEIELPDLGTPRGCSQALALIAQATGAGRIEPSAAKVLADLVEAAVRGLEVSDLQAQVDELRSRIGG